MRTWRRSTNSLHIVCNEFMMTLCFVWQNSELRMKLNTTPQQKTGHALSFVPANYFFSWNKRLWLLFTLPEVLRNQAESDEHSKHPRSSELRSCFNNESLTWRREKLFTGEQNTLGFGVWKLIDAFCIGNVIQMGSVCSSNASTSSKIAP